MYIHIAQDILALDYIDTEFIELLANECDTSLVDHPDQTRLESMYMLLKKFYDLGLLDKKAMLVIDVITAKQALRMYQENENKAS